MPPFSSDRGAQNKANFLTPSGSHDLHRSLEVKASAIIVAAGSGTRLGSDLPKAFVELCGRSMLSYSLRTIAAVSTIEEAVVTVPSGMESLTRAEVRAAGLEIPVKLTPGGAERQDSVRIALALTSAEAELVVVHDAARPFATPPMFEGALATAARVGGAIAAIPLADTLKSVSDRDTAASHGASSTRGPATSSDGGAPNGGGSTRHRVGTGDALATPRGTATEHDATAGHASGSGHRVIVATVARTALWQAQTPQAFRRDLLIRAHERATRERVIATDDADLVEQLGAAVEVIDGSAFNFKITTAEDLRLAKLIAAALPNRSD